MYRFGSLPFSLLPERSGSFQKTERHRSNLTPYPDTAPAWPCAAGLLRSSTVSARHAWPALAAGWGHPVLEGELFQGQNNLPHTPGYVPVPHSPTRSYRYRSCCRTLPVRAGASGSEHSVFVFHPLSADGQFAPCSCHSIHKPPFLPADGSFPSRRSGCAPASSSGPLQTFLAQ